jgi:hypothetical protein
MKLIAKLFLKKNHLDDISCLQKPRTNNQIFKFSSSKNKDNGSSMVELLLATTLALVAINASAQLISRLYTSGLNSRAAANSAVEVAINNDLAWFRRFAVFWQRTTIPPGCSSIPTVTVSKMADDFLKDAADQTKYPPLAVNPPSTDNPPNTVPNATNILPSSVSGYTLSRAIKSDNDVSGALIITYTLTVTGTAPNTTTTIFVRSGSLSLPAAGWCP